MQPGCWCYQPTDLDSGCISSRLYRLKSYTSRRDSHLGVSFAPSVAGSCPEHSCHAEAFSHHVAGERGRALRFREACTRPDDHTVRASAPTERGGGPHSLPRDPHATGTSPTRES